SLQTGDTTTAFSQVFNSRNFGPRILTASGVVNDGNSGDNYSYTFHTAAGTINQYALDVTAASSTKTYDGTTSSTGSPTITGGTSLRTGDTTTTFSAIFDSRNAAARTLTASGVVNDGNSGLNYSYTFHAATGTINQYALDVTAASDTKTYDGTAISSPSPTIPGGTSLQTGDTTTTFSEVFDSRNAGSRTLTASGVVNDGNAGNNYSYTFQIPSGTINQYALDVTAAGDPKTYDGTTSSTGSPTITGGTSLQTGDT